MKKMGRTFGENVERIRMKKGWSQVDLAMAMHYKSQSMVSEIESGTRQNIRSHTVRKLANALGCSIDELYEGVEFCE